jgi:hypothetical protein
MGIKVVTTCNFGEFRLLDWGEGETAVGLEGVLSIQPPKPMAIAASSKSDLD